MTRENIDKILSELNYNYRNNIWELINKLSIYKNISDLTFSEILKKYSYQVNYVLQQKNVVQKFNKVIRDFLLTYKMPLIKTTYPLDKASKWHTPPKHLKGKLKPEDYIKLHY